MDAQGNIRWFSDIRLNDVGLVGGKALRLASYIPCFRPKASGCRMDLP